MDSTEQTRQLVDELYATLRTGDRARLAALFTDDVEWYTPETAPIGPIKGAEQVAAELAGDTPKKLFDMKTFRLDVRKVTVDGDTAIVQQALSATTRQGARYENEYCWVYTYRDGKVAKIVEYADTLKAARIFGWAEA
jgi:uncharacterized protein (TIGR02246 family)